MEETQFTRLADYFAIIGITKQLKLNTPDNQLGSIVLQSSLMIHY